MKLLFVGNANSYLLINLAIEIKKQNPKILIDILSDQPVVIEESKKAFDNRFEINSGSKWRNVKFLKVFWYAWQYRVLLNDIPENYDAIHIFYLSSIYRLIWNRLRVRTSNLIITVFGSEFYRSNFIIKMAQKKMISGADKISATNPVTLNAVASFFKIPDKKQYLCRFGLSIIDELDTVTIDEVNVFRQNFSAPEDTNIIACGYNASVNQNLEKIIEQINSVKSSLGKYLLFFQWPAASDKHYVGKLRSLLESYNLPYRVLDKVYTNHELAVYRKSVDVMIQVQNTDQFSGAMTEHIYAGNKVVTGNWLPYQVLDELGVQMFKVSALGEIGMILQNIGEKEINKDHNRNAIQKICSWKETIKNWLILYQ